jgi:hypothetical protein
VFLPVSKHYPRKKKIIPFLPDCKLRCDIGPDEDMDDKLHALTIPQCSFYCECGTLSSGQVENGGISPGKKYQLLWRVGLAVRLMELDGGVVRVRAVQNQTMMMGPVVRVIVNSRK